MSTFDHASIPDLRGKYALVTGPTSGIGRGTALALGRTRAWRSPE